MSDNEGKKDVVPSKYRDAYKATGGTCGDFIAKTLSGVGGDSGVAGLNSIKKENGIEADRWSTLNPGMQRMNLANTLRASYLKGETIKLLGKQYNAKHQAQDFNGDLKDNKTTMSKLTDLLDLQDSERTVAALRKLFFPVEKAAKKVKVKEAKVEKPAKATKTKEAA